MNAKRIAALRALELRVAPGPWEAMTFSTEMVNSYAPSSRGYIVVRDANKKTQRTDYDAAFIAASRTALPEALDEIDRLNGILRSIEAAVYDRRELGDVTTLTVREPHENTGARVRAVLEDW